MAQIRPPDGDNKDWWHRLNKALGTISMLRERFIVTNTICVSFAFCHIPETHINAALAMIEAAAPRTKLKLRSLSDGLHHTAALAVLASG